MAYNFVYGSFVHPSCECYPKRLLFNALHSDRGVRWGANLRLEVGGDLVSSTATALTPATLQTRIAALDAAYTNDYQDAGFKLDNVWTPHSMLNSDDDNLSGNRILYRSWDNVLPTEMANTRSFSVAIEAIYRQSYSEVLHFSETTSKIGTGGPMWRLYPTWTGVPVKEEITDQTPVIHRTSGKIVALSGFLSPPAPYWPDEEQQWRRTITYHSPTMHGDPSKDLTHYVTTYSYSFLRLGPDPMTSFNTWYTP